MFTCGGESDGCGQQVPVRRDRRETGGHRCHCDTAAIALIQHGIPISIEHKRPPDPLLTPILSKHSIEAFRTFQHADRHAARHDGQGGPAGPEDATDDHGHDPGTNRDAAETALGACLTFMLLYLTMQSVDRYKEFMAFKKSDAEPHPTTDHAKDARMSKPGFWSKYDALVYWSNADDVAATSDTEGRAGQHG
jgi:hypothetical protein